MREQERITDFLKAKGWTKDPDMNADRFLSPARPRKDPGYYSVIAYENGWWELEVMEEYDREGYEGEPEETVRAWAAVEDDSGLETLRPVLFDLGIASPDLTDAIGDDGSDRAYENSLG